MRKISRDCSLKYSVLKEMTLLDNIEKTEPATFNSCSSIFEEHKYITSSSVRTKKDQNGFKFEFENRAIFNKAMSHFFFLISLD